MLIALIVVAMWLVALLLACALCRAAAINDGTYPGPPRPRGQPEQALTSKP